MPRAPVTWNTSRSVPATVVSLFLSTGFLIWAGLAWAADPSRDPSTKLTAAEPEFQVNSYTTDGQLSTSVDAYDGGFIAIWRSSGSHFDDSDASSIQGQRFDQDGHVVASEFQVNSYTTGGQSNPSVASWADGRFIAAWRDGSNVRARLFDSFGSPVSGDFVVATNSTYINSPDVDVRDDSFFVVWTEDGVDGDGRSVGGRRFSSDGTALGAAIQVNSYTTGFQAGANVQTSPDQDFVVTWLSGGSFGDDPGQSIQMRNLGPDGTVVGTEFQVNSYTPGITYNPYLDFADDSSFVVVWTNYTGSPGNDDDYTAVLARRFDSVGAALGIDFQVNAFTTGYQYSSDLRTTPDGGFIVAWYGEVVGSADSDAFGTVLHRFDSAGVSAGGDQLANSLTSGNQEEPKLARNSRGDFLVVWHSEVSGGNDSFSSSIQARFFAAESDVAVTVDNGVDTVVPGGAVVYTVEVTNAGPDLGSGVELTDTLPSDIVCDWTSVASGGATGNTVSGSGDLSETLRLPPAATVTYTLDCDVASGATGSLLHSADIVVDQVDAVASNDSAFDLDVLERSTDLELSLSASAPQVGPGDEFELTASVTQNGPSASSGAMVFDGLPPELTFVASADCALTAGFVACEIPPLDPGEEASVTYRVAIDPGLVPGMMIEDQAVVLADDEDPNASNDFGAVTVAVIEPFVFADGFESGDTTMWTTTVP